jgi:hypothetical protein
LQHALARRRQAPEERSRVLVAAVLRPEQREDRQLEVVRVSPQELPDTVGFPVGETESAMERLFRDLRQVTQSSGPTGELLVAVLLHVPVLRRHALEASELGEREAGVPLPFVFG